MEEYVQTDLACEVIGEGESLPKGVEHQIRTVGGISVSRVLISERAASEALNRPCGCYVSYQGHRLNLLGGSEEETLVRLLGGELRTMATRLSGKQVDPRFSVCVVGLGNRELTADALGPLVTSRLTATRHLREEARDLYGSLQCCQISTVTPGVLGQTGIESLELLCGVVESVSPDLLIAVDALAARSCERLASTVQLSDTGICPGSGVGNHRSEISRKTLGVPVISLGIPTVVHSSTLVLDALREAGMEEVEDSLHSVLQNRRSFFVTPKDCDGVTQAGVRILSRAITVAFASELDETHR
ncbi:MAG: GPR endopeptidase [Clostridia bacterium]|nr:GPR endopeptidase [Clostridia bacterium]